MKTYTSSRSGAMMGRGASRAALLAAAFAVVFLSTGARGQGQPQLLLQGRFYPGPDSSGYATVPQTMSCASGPLSPLGHRF